MKSRVRDWKGESILKKCAKTNACVWSEAKAVALKSPTVAAVEFIETKAAGTPKILDRRKF